MLRLWLRCRRGATAIEYGLIAAGISVAIMAAVFSIGDKMAAMFQTMYEMVLGRL